MRANQRKFLGTLFGVLLFACLYTFNLLPSDPPQTSSPVVATSTTGSSVVVDPSPSSTVSTPVLATSTNALVIRSVDGDTLTALYDGQSDEVKVRLLGVNTPESVDPRRGVQCFGKEASTFLRNLVEGKRVRLEEDPAADERDKYGRLLRNVITEEGKDVNALLVQEGYANAYVSFPQNKQRKADLRRFEAQAKAAQKGLWNPQTCNGQK